VPVLEFSPAAFPPAPPSCLSDAQHLVEHDWSCFSSIDRMKNHWVRPGWTEARRVYYWMLTFPNERGLIQLAEECQGRLAPLGMDPVSADGLHVTMVRVGDTHEVSTAQLHELVRRVEESSPKSFPLLAHPLAGSRGALRFTLSPWAPLVKLHDLLSAAGKRSGVPGGKPTNAFRPHLGILYNNQDRPARAVVESVEPLRSLPALALEVTSVELVELRRTEAPVPAYRWNVVGGVSLEP
jgi:2'-5' RNA ligase